MNTIVRPLRELTLTLFILFVVNLTFAQKFNFTKYSVEDGLPQSTVYDICQDSKNYLWLATDGGGIARYDGHYFKTYNKKDGLTENVIRKIIIDKNDNKWLATNGGLIFFDGKKFTKINLSKEKKNIYILALCVRGNKIYAGSSGDGLFEVDITTRKVSQFLSTNGNIASNYIFDLALDHSGNIWIANYEGGLSCIKSNGEVASIKNDALFGYYCLSLSLLKDGKMLCGTKEAGYFIFDPVKYAKGEINGETNFYLKNSSVWDAGYYNNQLYVATQENGIYLIDEKLNDIKINFTKENGAPSNQYYSVFSDKENNLWLGSSGSGLVKFSGFNFLNFDKSQINTSSGVRTIYQHSPNTFWLGTDDAVFELKKNSSYNYSISKQKDLLNVKGVISSFAKDANANYYAGSKSNGLYILNNQNYVVNYTFDNGLASDNVSSILARKSDNSVWVGTDGGISLARNGEILTISESNGLINNEVQKLDLINNCVVAATNGGLVVFSGTSMQSYDKAEGIKEVRLNTFCADKTGKLYLGTFGDGIYVSDNATGKIKKFSKLPVKSLDFENIYSLTFCNDTLLAVTSDKGLTILILKNNRVEKSFLFNDQNGFEGIESNLNANLLSSNGNLFLGTVTGLSILNLKDFSLKLISPSVNIDSIKINDKAYPELPISLSYNMNSIELQTSLIGFSNVPQNKLEYMLEGYDTHWNTVVSNVFKEYGVYKVKYNKLPPGKYKLIFKGICTDGVTPSIKSFEFEINPPFWSTLWFKLLVTIILIAGIFSIIRLRVKILKDKNRQLEEIVTIRTKEILIQKEEIEIKNKELNHQNEEILAQQDEIRQQSILLKDKNQEITDSINYAQRIQNSLLPDLNEIENKHKNLFVIFKPKDIVSGDFYWINSKENELNIVAADCTGHGVPGAFMSLIGIEKLNDIYEKQSSPSKILSGLNNSVKHTLKQNSTSNAKDGMDLAYISIRENNLIYAGANRPLYIMRKGNFEITEIKADKVAIGGFTEFDYFFKEHTITLNKGDRVYVFSDGYADQFGGEFGKKLMTKRFKEMIIESYNYTMAEQKMYLINQFELWRNEQDQIDDVLVIGYEY